MSIESLLNKLITNLNDRKGMSKKLVTSIRSHSQGFEMAPVCLEDGYFLLRVYPFIPLEENTETDGEAISVVKLTPSDTIRIRTFNDCWVELLDISEAQYETYLTFGSFTEMNSSLEYNLNEDDRFTIWKFSVFN